MLGDREWEWEGMGTSIWENNRNGNKRLDGVGMGMGLKLVGMGRNGKAGSHSRTPLLDTCPQMTTFHLSSHRASSPLKEPKITLLR